MSTRFMFSHAAVRTATGVEPAVHTIGSAKQASVLFDEVMFERRLGVIEGADGHQVIRAISSDEAKRLRAAGMDIAEWADTSDLFTDDPEVPGSGHGSWNNLYGVLSDLGCNWARELFFDPGVVATTASFHGEEPWKRELRAIAVNYETSLYRPASEGELVGSTALAVLVPEVHSLRWEAIAEFRGHPASSEARHMLRDFDAAARLGSVDVQDVVEFQRSVAQEIARALFAAWAESRPSLGTGLAKEAVKTGIGFIPIAGAPISAAASVAELAAAVNKHDRTWLSALWNLASSDR